MADISEHCFFIHSHTQQIIITQVYNKDNSLHRKFNPAGIIPLLVDSSLGESRVQVSHSVRLAVKMGQWSMKDWIIASWIFTPLLVQQRSLVDTTPEAIEIGILARPLQRHLFNQWDFQVVEVCL